MSLEFNSLDRNHNNKLSREEANHDGDIGSGFAKADSNRDGALDAGEYANFKSAIQQAHLEAYLNDSTITAKIKTELLKENGLQGLTISVETFHGKVILSGFVDNGQQVRRAVEIASGIRGVNQVKNSLQLKG